MLGAGAPVALARLETLALEGRTLAADGARLTSQGDKLERALAVGLGIALDAERKGFAKARLIVAQEMLMLEQHNDGSAQFDAAIAAFERLEAELDRFYDREYPLPAGAEQLDDQGGGRSG